MTKIELMLFQDLLRKFVKQMMMQIGVYNNELEKEFIDKAADYGKENIASNEQITMAALCIGSMLNTASLVGFGTRAEEEER